MADAPKTIPLEDLFPEGTRTTRTRAPRGSGPARIPSAPGITKQIFVDAFELASAGLSLAGANDYALSKEEIERMADSWYRLAKEYPSFGKQVVKGNRVTVWGNLFIVNAIVVGKRVEMAVDAWQSRPKKTAQPRPAQQPRPTAPVQARPTAVQPRPITDDPAQWGPSSPELLGPTGT